MVRQFLRFDLLEAKGRFGEIFHAIIGQFITFTTDVFLRRKQQPFFMPFGTAIILHNLRV